MRRHDYNWLLQKLHGKIGNEWLREMNHFLITFQLLLWTLLTFSKSTVVFSKGIADRKFCIVWVDSVWRKLLHYPGWVLSIVPFLHQRSRGRPKGVPHRDSYNEQSQKALVSVKRRWHWSLVYDPNVYILQIAKWTII